MIGIDPEAPFGLEFARMANHILRVLELVASENGDYVGLRLDAAGGAELAKPCQSGTGSRLGADAIGYTLYVGTPAQERDFEQYRVVRADALRLGMPLIVWAYPRGSASGAVGKCASARHHLNILMISCLETGESADMFASGATATI